MKKNLLYILTIVLGCTTVSLAQRAQDEIFKDEAQRIKNRILDITKSEKEALKKSVDSINTLLEDNKISFEKANQLKDEVAQERAKRIEEKVNKQNEKLSALVKSKAQGSVQSSTNSFMVSLSTQKGLEVYVNDSIRNKNDVIRSKTTFHITIAYGYNTSIVGGNLPYYNSKSFGSNFSEWGFTLNTRLKQYSNALNLRYGLSYMDNNISPKSHYYFVKNENQTDVMTAPTKFSKNKFKTGYLAVPVHFEYRYGKESEYRIGLGGYVGYNLSAEQRLKYRDDGRRVKDFIRQDWNVNQWNYGLSFYIGIGDISLYAKYDLNPLFRNNAVDQHNISVGLRLDI